MAKLVIYLVVLITYFASVIRGTPPSIRISNSIVQIEELRPGEDYSHFISKREANPEPHGGGGHGGGFGGGRGGGFGGGHGGGFGGGHGGGFGGYGGGYGGFGHGIGHYGGGFGGRPIGLGGFIPAPVYRHSPYGYGRYRRSLNAPQFKPHSSLESVEGDKVLPNIVTNPRNNTTNTSSLLDQQERKKIELRTDSEDIITSNTPILVNPQIQREINQRSADAIAGAGHPDRYSNLDYDGYGKYRYRYGNGGRKLYSGFYGGGEALVFPVGNVRVARPGYDYAGYGYDGHNLRTIEI